MVISYIERQREIGKQLFLVNILHCINERVRKGGYSFLSRDELAKWASMTEDELDDFIDACASLDPYNIASEAAMKFFGDEPFESEEDSFFFIISTYRRMGERFIASLEIDKFEDHCKKLAELNYRIYSENHPDFPVNESFSTPEVFMQVMRVYIRYVLTLVKEVKSEGYFWEVITSMMKTDLTKNRYRSLVNAFGEGTQEMN